MPAARNSYSFKEGLTMMAAKAVGIDPYLAAEGGENARAAINAIRNATKTKAPKDRAGFVREAQNEMRSISAAQHPKLVNALNAKLLALQGRGGDTQVAHVEPGEMVIPRAMLTPEVMRMITQEAAKRGIDPRRLLVGGKGSINPATGEEEFGVLDTIKGWFGGDSGKLDVDSIPVTATRRVESLYPPLPSSDHSPLPSVLKDMQFYKPWEDTPHNDLYLKLQDSRFRMATADKNFAGMDEVANETKARAFPSGIDQNFNPRIAREPMTAQQKADFALQQNVIVDAHKIAEPETTRGPLKAFNNNEYQDSPFHFKGSDGRLYWRDPSVVRSAVTPTDFFTSWQPQLDAEGFRDATRRGDPRKAISLLPKLQ